MLAKALELGSCGVQWTPPEGAIGEHTDTKLVVTEDDGTVWTIELLPAGFAIGAGEEAALSDDIHDSARIAGSRVLEAKLGRIGEGRCARVFRQWRDRTFTGELIIPVAKGAIDLRVAGIDIDVVRAALDSVLENIEVTALPERTTEVALTGAGVACEPPLRFLPVAAEGKGVLIRSGLDGWRRMIEIWRIGRHKLKGKDLHAELVEHANKSVEDWPNVQTDTQAIDDFGVCLQVEQFVIFSDERGTEKQALFRWWIAGDQSLWRLSSVAPTGVERDAMRRDLEQVQETFRRL
ncbi:MAG TPA: hypothetical protein VMZ53_33970 [Kofleriaceae bacterium]|nr:hypothetical protein [Kofleriaceae bacterium]